MSKSEAKARPDVTAPGRAAETKLTKQAISISDNDFITNSGERQANAKQNESKRRAGVIEQLLPRGLENAVTTRELVRLTGVKNARTLQSAIAIERESGALILSTGKSGGGYFLPDEGEKGTHEITEFVHTLYGRAVNTLRMLRNARRAVALSEVEGQQTIE